MSTWTGSQFVVIQAGSTVSTTPSGDFLLKTNNLSDVPNQHTARQNLGINISPVAPSGPQLNDIWVDTDDVPVLWTSVGGKKWSDL